MVDPVTVGSEPDNGGFVDRLVDLAVLGLRAMYVPETQEFVQTVRGLSGPAGPHLAPEGRNLRYAAIAALGLALADIVTATQLPEGVTCDASLWAACIGGAAQRDDYLAMIEHAGFEVRTVRDNDYRFVSERAAGATATYGVSSVSLLALRL